MKNEADEGIFEEIRKVGAYSNETIISGVKELEMLLQLKEPPKSGEVESLASHIATMLGNDYDVSSNTDSAQITGDNALCNGIT